LQPLINQIEINPYLYRKETIAFFEGESVRFEVRLCASKTFKHADTTRSNTLIQACPNTLIQEHVQAYRALRQAKSFGDDTIQKIAQAHSRSPSQV
jgi:diketogulonate reductase-like aldo/keto reductase